MLFQRHLFRFSFPKFRTRIALWFLTVTAMAMLLGSDAALGQAPKTDAKAAAPKPKASAKSEKEKIPAPVELGGNDLVTKDGVVLKATFYPSNKGKDAVPIILLHMWKGDRREYSALAAELQKLGHAVLIPDLRGHGESTQRQFGTTVDTLDASRFTRNDFARMVQYDMETLKSFLMKKNNEGELNIEKLTIVGAEMGASVAMDWARLDWSWPLLAGKKQGQDVKALVLLSPEFSFRGLDIKGAMSHPAVRSQLATMILVGGRDSRAATEANRIYTMLQRFHPEPKGDEPRDLYFAKLDTELQGTKMLGQRLNVEPWIVNFLQIHLVNENYPWRDRSG
jgi:pimeloyl-ACP methyl ester carboxylesterase